MSDTGEGRVPSEPGSREPSPTVSAASGFDPSRGTRRLEEFRAAQQQAQAIAHAAEIAVPAEKASRWLAQYRRSAVDRDTISVTWRPTAAGACDGANEAADYIRGAIALMLPTIIAEAETLAEADMLRLMNLFAPVDRNPEGEDAATRLSAEHESAVTAQPAGANNLSDRKDLPA